MSNGDEQPKLSPVPFLYEMVTSFFEAARQTLESRPASHRRLRGPRAPGRRQTRISRLGNAEVRRTSPWRPRSPPRRLPSSHNQPRPRLRAFLPPAEFHYPGQGLSSTQRDESIISRSCTMPFRATCAINSPGYTSKVGSHDLEIEMSAGPFPSESIDDQDRTKGLRSQLAYWQSRRLLHESHLSVTATPDRTITRFFIPLRSVLILDRILAEPHRSEARPPLPEDGRTAFQPYGESQTRVEGRHGLRVASRQARPNARSQMEAYRHIRRSHQGVGHGTLGARIRNTLQHLLLC